MGLVHSRGESFFDAVTKARMACLFIHFFLNQPLLQVGATFFLMQFPLGNAEIQNSYEFFWVPSRGGQCKPFQRTQTVQVCRAKKKKKKKKKKEKKKKKKKKRKKKKKKKKKKKS